MRSNPVEQIQVGLQLESEFVAVSDLLSVQVLIFDLLEEPLNHSVGLRSWVFGPDVFQVRPGHEEPSDGRGLESWAVVGDHHRGVTSPVSSLVNSSSRPNLMVTIPI